MEGPSWDLAIPSPNCTQPCMEYVPTGAAGRIESLPVGNAVQGSLSSDHSRTPLSSKKPVDPKNISPQSCTLNPAFNIGANLSSRGSTAGDLGRDAANSPAGNFKLSRTLDPPKAFIQMRTCGSGELLELHSSVVATIERNSDAYVCIHDVLDVVAKKMGGCKKQIKWRHYDENSFLFVLEDKAKRDWFVAENQSIFIDDAAITFKPWRPACPTNKNRGLFKVWLRLRGIPIEYFNFECAQVIVCSFSRLERCNMEKKKSFVGAFYVMVECQNLDDVKATVDVYLEDGRKLPVSIDRLYGCSSDVFNEFNRAAELKSYDDTIASLIDAGKMLLL